MNTKKRLNSSFVRCNRNCPFFFKKKDITHRYEPKKYKIIKKKQTLKNPLIFYTISEFLDDETIYEIKHVNKSMMELIKKNEKFDYKTLKVLLERIRFLKVKIFI